MLLSQLWDEWSAGGTWPRRWLGLRLSRRDAGANPTPRGQQTAQRARYPSPKPRHPVHLTLTRGGAVMRTTIKAKQSKPSSKGLTSAGSPARAGALRVLRGARFLGGALSTLRRDRPAWLLGHRQTFRAASLQARPTRWRESCRASVQPRTVRSLASRPGRACRNRRGWARRCGRGQAPPWGPFRTRRPGHRPSGRPMRALRRGASWFRLCGRSRRAARGTALPHPQLCSRASRAAGSAFPRPSDPLCPQLKRQEQGEDLGDPQGTGPADAA